MSLKAANELAGDECECECGMSIGDNEGWRLVSGSASHCEYEKSGWVC